MAVIEVNHKTLRNVAKAIDNYCDEQNREMRSADSAVKQMLSSGWTGADAYTFSDKWESVDDSSSTTVKLRDSLKKYSEGLTACANEYQNAQEEAYNEANRLPKWIYW